MMEQIQSFFGGIGRIRFTESDNTVHFLVNKFNECLIIRYHF